MRRDVALLIASRAIRSLAFGYLTFVIPLYLKSIGFSQPSSASTSLLPQYPQQPWYLPLDFSVT
ncbi:hypothetical protein [Vulcanisaeta souniana]|uniref:hypothetical protein n=1 Tax=Vulcanisaeta souniana TaxID=164452 RepID=UPI000ADA8BCA|nr:hypothetical protein [Vulcanisaeta souniana]